MNKCLYEYIFRKYILSTYSAGQKFETTYIKEGKWNRTQNIKEEI